MALYRFSSKTQFWSLLSAPDVNCAEHYNDHISTFGTHRSHSLREKLLPPDRQTDYNNSPVHA